MGAGRGRFDPRGHRLHGQSGVRSAVGSVPDVGRGQARTEHVLMDTVARHRRERPKVVTLTEAAAERVREIMARAEKPYAGLRVGVKNGGCAGQEYIVEYAV